MKQTSTMSASVTQFKVSDGPIELVMLTGELSRAGADAFLQVFEDNVVIGNQVPIISRRIYGADRFELNLSPGLALKNCIVALSKVEGSWTVDDVAGTGFTLTALYKEPVQWPRATVSGVSYAADADGKIIITNDAAGAILYRYSFQNGHTSNLYGLICGVALASIAGATPLYSVLVPAGTTVNLDWGKSGVRIASALSACFSTTATTATVSSAGGASRLYGVITAL